MGNQHNNSLPSLGNRNLANMAQDANVLHDELEAVRKRVQWDIEAVQDRCREILNEIDRLVKSEDTLWNMHVFLTREAAFGHNFK